MDFSLFCAKLYKELWAPLSYSLRLNIIWHSDSKFVLKSLINFMPSTSYKSDWGGGGGSTGLSRCTCVPQYKNACCLRFLFPFVLQNAYHARWLFTTSPSICLFILLSIGTWTLYFLTRVKFPLYAIYLLLFVYQSTMHMLVCYICWEENTYGCKCAGLITWR